MLFAKNIIALVAAALVAHAAPLSAEEYSLLLRGRMGSTASPANKLEAVPYAPEVEAADKAQVLGH